MTTLHRNGRLERPRRPLRRSRAASQSRRQQGTLSGSAPPTLKSLLAQSTVYPRPARAVDEAALDEHNAPVPGVWAGRAANWLFSFCWLWFVHGIPPFKLTGQSRRRRAEEASRTEIPACFARFCSAKCRSEGSSRARWRLTSVHQSQAVAEQRGGRLSAGAPDRMKTQMRTLAEPSGPPRSCHSCIHRALALSQIDGYSV